MTRKSSQKNHQKDEKISMEKSQKNALKLAIHALEDYRRRHYAAARSAAVYGFEFGINGEKHYKEYTNAIEYLRSLLAETPTSVKAQTARQQQLLLF
jgi:hypothetical protein